MKKLIRYIGVLILGVGVASCSSTRKMQRSPMIGGLTGEAYVEKVIEWAPEWQTVSGKVALQLDLGKMGNAALDATLRLKKGELIRLSVAPLLGIEVARLDISPKGLLLIDRLHKRYVQLSFEEIRALWQVDLSFNILQSLFLNEVFFPGKLGLEPADAKLFFVTSEGEEALLEAKTAKRLSYRFRTSSQDASLLETRIGMAGFPYEICWQYRDFEPLSGRHFPASMQVEVEGMEKPLSLNMHFSRLSTGDRWDATSEVSSRYKQISIQELLKMLIQK